MKQKHNIAVTGYYGTGSSAVLDLLSEYDATSVVPAIGRCYEHSLFYYPNGLFDLCTLLSHGNTPQGSDMVINRFIDSMKRLNDNEFDWFGSFRKLYGDRFWAIVEDFVDEISEHHNGTNSFHVLSSRFSLVKFISQVVLSRFLKRTFATKGKVYKMDHKPVYFSMPSSDTLFESAKKFTSAYFDLNQIDGIDNLVFDHIIWPQQVDEFSQCFNNSFKVIIVDRDPRDLFVFDKYLWRTPQLGGGKPHFGGDVNHFVDEWKKTIVRSFSNPNALHIHFEDLVYSYQRTIDAIESFLGFTKGEHISPKSKFQPEKSIENTQAFRIKGKWDSEVEIIENELSDYLYSFPYIREPEKNLMFDHTEH